jgi:hypothetical protein
MAFCEHCEGQRFDRARVLRALRQMKKDLRGADRRTAQATLDLALRTIRTMDIPHLEIIEDGSDMVH